MEQILAWRREDINFYPQTKKSVTGLCRKNFFLEFRGKKKKKEQK
jgi:hypothetical protein